MYANWQKRVFHWTNDYKKRRIHSVGVLSYMIQTTGPYYNSEHYDNIFFWMETGVVIIFCFDLLVSLWVRPGTAKLWWFLSMFKSYLSCLTLSNWVPLRPTRSDGSKYFGWLGRSDYSIIRTYQSFSNLGSYHSFNWFGPFVFHYFHDHIWSVSLLH